MSHAHLFDRIHAVRDQLKANQEFGKLTAERFLISAGDLIGQWFCFEQADLKWQFDEEFIEVWQSGELASKIELSQVNFSESTGGERSPAAGEDGKLVPIRKAA